jgi:hypothetical protein
VTPTVLLRRLLLLPLLAPLLAVLLVGALNPRPWVGLRLLIWRTPEWTIGSWLALAAGGGGALSAAATALALQAGSTGPRRQLHRPIQAGHSRRPLALGAERRSRGWKGRSLGGWPRPGSSRGLEQANRGPRRSPRVPPGLGRAEPPSSRTAPHPLGALPGDPPRHGPGC